MYLFLVALGLCCCMWAFSSCGMWAAHFSGFSCCGAQALGCVGSTVVALGLSCPKAYGICLGQEWNLYSLHWKADSQPQQGSPIPCYLYVHLVKSGSDPT